MIRAAKFVGLRPHLLRPAISAITNQQLASSTSSPSSQEDFFAKNERLKRPMSPWMIYKFQLTSMLSITHRGTGLGMGVVLYAWGINSLLSSNTNWAQTLEALSAAVPSSLLYTVKVLVATSFGYHAINGIRHLAWDLGYGFTIKELYTSGYVVLALSVLIGLAVLSKS